MKHKTFWKIFVAGWVSLLLVSGTRVIFAQSGAQSAQNLSGSGAGSSTNAQQSPDAGTLSTGAADAIEPSDVENLKAQPGDSQVQLTWDSATDNVGVTGYKIYRGTRPVKSPEDSYDLPVIPAGSVKTYTVNNLQNGQPYYFSVTAVDGAGNESPNYATEANATPSAGLRLAALEDDGKPPQIKDVQAEDVITVTVEFSEQVKLPEEQAPSAFRIEKTLDKSRLQVQKAEMDARDEKGLTVVLTTAPQEEDASYVLTAGIEVQDYYGNPIVSGTADTGSFEGSAKQKTPPPAPAPSPVAPGFGSGAPDKTAPAVTGGSAPMGNRFAVEFSEKVNPPANPRSKISIYKKGTRTGLNVLNVSMSVDGKTAYVTTDPQQSVEYEVRVAGFTDDAGNEIDLRADSTTVQGNQSALQDVTPPEDVTGLIARLKNAQEHLVELRWEGSKDSAKDLADQLLYQSAGKMKNDYGAGTGVGTSTRGVEVEDLAPGKWYTFKVSAKDTSGNESRGAVTTIYLPQTGPGALSAGLTGLFMGWYRRRKGKKSG